jgi:hypothetical protein
MGFTGPQMARMALDGIHRAADGADGVDGIHQAADGADGVRWDSPGRRWRGWHDGIHQAADLRTNAPAPAPTPGLHLSHQRRQPRGFRLRDSVAERRDPFRSWRCGALQKPVKERYGKYGPESVMRK